MFYSEDFDARTRSNMDVALDRACALSPSTFVDHEARKFVAARIRNCAENGNRTLTGLTRIGRLAAADLVLGESPQYGLKLDSSVGSAAGASGL